MLSCSADKKDVDITHCDAGYPPGSKPYNIQNKTAVWFKVNDKWYRSRFASAILTAHHIRRTQYNDLLTLSDSVSDLIPSQEKTREA